MFYLRKIKKLFKQSPLTCLFYAISTFILVLTVNVSNEAVSFIEKRGEDIKISPFFHALIDENENYTRYSRKLRALPGVKSVEISRPEEIKSQANDLLGSLDIDISSDLIDMGYAGIKVIFDTNLHDKSISLVRDYLIRLVGKESITVGELIKTDNKKEVSPLKEFVYNNLYWILISSVAVLWTFINFVFVKVFNNQIYLIENFQRKNHFSMKLYTIYSGLCIAIVTIAYSIKSFDISNLLVLMALFVLGGAIHYRKWQWTK